MQNDRNNAMNEKINHKHLNINYWVDRNGLMHNFQLLHE